MRRLTEWLICLLACPALAQASDAVEAEIRFDVAEAGPAWVGQEIELYLELWSNGLSFGDQVFRVPEVPGGYLLQADASTLNLNENRGGEPWQGLRYTFLLYPQRAGQMVVPAFDVRFTARMGFGFEPARFELQTAALAIEVRLPEGGRADALTVTTRSFSLESSWSRVFPDEGPLVLQTGDALTLEVRRRAGDLPAMVFEPLPVPSIEGLGVYPAAPQVNDRVNRGELTGERIDRMTFVCERAGRYEIPEWRFQWWDPERGVLAEKVIAAQTLEVAANPAYGSAPTVADLQPGSAFPWRTLLIAMAILALTLVTGVRLARPAARWIREKRARTGDPRRRTGLLVPLNPRS